MLDFGLMDYSLLIGVKRQTFEIHKKAIVTPKVTDQNHDRQGISNLCNSVNYRTYNQDSDGAIHAAVVEAQGTFYIGIIDILQEWNWSKRFERFIKTSLLGMNILYNLFDSSALTFYPYY